MWSSKYRIEKIGEVTELVDIKRIKYVITIVDAAGDKNVIHKTATDTFYVSGEFLTKEIEKKETYTSKQTKYWGFNDDGILSCKVVPNGKAGWFSSDLGMLRYLVDDNGRTWVNYTIVGWETIQLEDKTEIVKLATYRLVRV